jgi:peptidoglycan/LPS O-acetylase OafA/YrhL
LNDGTISWRNFLVARLARLYPLHVLALLIFAAVYLLRFRQFPDYVDGTGWSFLLQLVLLQNVGLTPAEITWNAPSWSISVEFWVNVLVFSLIVRGRSSAFLLGFACVAYLILYLEYGTLAVSFQNLGGWFNSGIIRGLAAFALGMVVYRQYRIWGAYATLNRGRAAAAQIAAAVSLLCYIAFPRDNLGYWDFGAPIVFSVCILVFSWETEWLRKCMVPLAYLGVISYSIYLLHYPILFFLRYLKEFAVGTRADAPWVGIVNSPIQGFLLYLVLVISVSHLCYVWFEVPSKRWLTRRFSSSAGRGRSLGG